MKALSMKPELRCGEFVPEQVVWNRFFTLGYSYFFHQAKSALEYEGSGSDRAHWVAGVNQNNIAVQNSEKLVQAVKELDKKEEVLDTYVLTAQRFDFNSEIAQLGGEDSEGISKTPVPTHFFMCVRTDLKNKNVEGGLNMYAFIIPNGKNEKVSDDFNEYACETSLVEKQTGLIIWPELFGDKIKQMKNRTKLIN